MFGLLFLAAVCATASSAEQTAGPAFVWGDAPVSGQNAGHSTVYQHMRAAHVATLVSNLTQHLGTPEGVDLVTILAGPQVNLRKVALGQASEFEALLKEQTHASSNSAAFPYVDSQGAWEDTVKPSQGDMWIGGSCRLPSSHPMAELSSALSNQQSRPSVLLLCLQDCAASGCMAEALQVVQQQASTQGLRQAFAYLPASTAQVKRETGVADMDLDATQRRRLLQTTATTTVLCNAKCQSQVKLYEAFILTATLLSALFTGLICMHALGTPERWEKPKDTQSRND